MNRSLSTQPKRKGKGHMPSRLEQFPPRWLKRPVAMGSISLVAAVMGCGRSPLEVTTAQDTVWCKLRFTDSDGVDRPFQSGWRINPDGHSSSNTPCKSDDLSCEPYEVDVAMPICNMTNGAHPDTETCNYLANLANTEYSDLGGSVYGSLQPNSTEVGCAASIQHKSSLLQLKASAPGQLLGTARASVPFWTFPNDYTESVRFIRGGAKINDTPLNVSDGHLDLYVAPTASGAKAATILGATIKFAPFKTTDGLDVRDLVLVLAQAVEVIGNDQGAYTHFSLPTGVLFNALATRATRMTHSIITNLVVTDPLVMADPRRPVA